MSKKRKAALAVFLLIGAVCAAYILWYYAAQAKQQAQYAALQAAAQQAAQQQAAEQAEASSAASSAALPESTPAVEIPIDFATLQAEYPDIYAWLEIPDTVVGYPLLRSPGRDDYYLDHNLDGSTGYPGCIYSQSCDAADFSDFNTVLYGHNMKNGSMFGGLKLYRDADYLQEHRTVIVYTPTEKLVYRVFAAVVYDDTLIPRAYDDASAEGRQAFLDSLGKTRSLNNQILDDIEVTADSRILTLSTCIGGQPNNRYLIVAVYTGEG